MSINEETQAVDDAAKRTGVNLPFIDLPFLAHLNLFLMRRRLLRLLASRRESLKDSWPVSHEFLMDLLDNKKKQFV